MKHERIVRVRVVADDSDLVYDDKPLAEGWEDFRVEIDNFLQQNPDGVWASMEFIQWEN